jgi:SAM-dependent methyltransferase
VERDEKEPGIEFSACCPTCGNFGTFRQTQFRLRETFACRNCRSTARYQVQAEALVQAVGEPVGASLAEIVAAGALNSCRVYEVGVSGPFRALLASLPNYVKSFYWSDVPPGAVREGVSCQDLMRLTFPDKSFDVVITSDIMEHVRRPDQAFAEIRRVLTRGGIHVFTVPTNVPFARPTVRRVDVSGPEDLHILPPAYHGDGAGGRSLVYNEFGGDLIDMLRDLGMSTQVFRHQGSPDLAERCLAFVSTRV